MTNEIVNHVILHARYSVVFFGTEIKINLSQSEQDCTAYPFHLIHLTKLIYQGNSVLKLKACVLKKRKKLIYKGLSVTHQD